MLSAEDFDRRHLWHPYSGMTDPGRVHRVSQAEGVWLTLSDGTRMIDAMSSWWCMAHGHRHPKIVSAMKAQLDRLPHVMFGGLTHDPAIELGRKLIEFLPDGLNRIFYSDSGSVAVEVSLKMALQAQVSRGHASRTTFATIRGGYHGDTWKAMSLCDPDTGMHGHFGNALQIQHFIPAPPIAFCGAWDEDPHRNGLAELAHLLEANGNEIAAFVLEPVVQGAGGMRFYHPAYLRGVRALCDAHGIILIFDEIATGFGRTGKMFAMDHAGVVPDIVCLGKALTGGHITFAATVARSAIADDIAAALPGVLMHGPTYMANPLACAAACASLDLLREGNWQTKVDDIESQLRTELEPARALPGVADVRVLGAIGVIECSVPLDSARVHAFAKTSGVFLRPFGKLLYTMPPYVISADELRQVTAAMVEIAGWTT